MCASTESGTGVGTGGGEGEGTTTEAEAGCVSAGTDAELAEIGAGAGRAGVEGVEGVEGAAADPTGLGTRHANVRYEVCPRTSGRALETFILFCVGCIVDVEGAVVAGVGVSAEAAEATGRDVDVEEEVVVTTISTSSVSRSILTLLLSPSSSSSTTSSAFLLRSIFLALRSAASLLALIWR